MDAGWSRHSQGGVNTELDELKLDPTDYDLVLIGAPVWVGTFPPAIRIYLERHKDSLKNVAVFTTQGSASRQRIFNEIKKFLNIDLRAELFLSSKSVRLKNIDEPIDHFIEFIS